MEYGIKIGDSIVVTVDGKVLSGKVTDTRDNSVGNRVIELELDESCRYEITLKGSREFND